MAYNEDLAERVRILLAGQQGVEERKMFGGLTFMVMGNMCCGVLNDDLVVRLGPDGFQEALANPQTRPMDFTGRPLNGMVYVGPEGHGTDEALKSWVEQAKGFALSLPPGKSRKSGREKKRR